jgi:hypothetical protein
VVPPHMLPLCYSSPRLQHVSHRLRLASHRYLALRHVSSLMCHVNIRRNTAASSFVIFLSFLFFCWSPFTRTSLFLAPATPCLRHTSHRVSFVTHRVIASSLACHHSVLPLVCPSTRRLNVALMGRAFPHTLLGRAFALGRTGLSFFLFCYLLTAPFSRLPFFYRCMGDSLSLTVLPYVCPSFLAKMCSADWVISFSEVILLVSFLLVQSWPGSSTIPSQLGIGSLVLIMCISFILHICQYHNCHLVIFLISCELLRFLSLATFLGLSTC